MNHRRNRSTRREVKRLDHKAFRQAERRGMDETQDNVRTDMWGRGADLPIPEDAPSNGRRHSKRKRVAKQRCSEGGAHAWERKTTHTKDFFRRVIKEPCATCIIRAADWDRQEKWATERGLSEDDFFYRYGNPYTRGATRGWCSDHGEKVEYTITKVHATCTKCGETKLVSSESDAWELRWGSDYKKKLTLPKRTVKLY